MTDEMAQHNHITRNFKPKGKCPGCDAYYERHGDISVGPAPDLPPPLPPVRNSPGKGGAES